MTKLLKENLTKENQIDRSLYRRLLNQAFEEGKELQRLEDIIFRVRQLASQKRSKVKALQSQAEELEKARLMTFAKDSKTSQKAQTKISKENLKAFFSEEELKTIFKEVRKCAK